MATVCTNCGFNNPPGMRFCGNCGTRLPASTETVPPAVASILTPPAPDPEKLGVMTGADLLERFRQAGLESAGQRRSVTILFVDLSGYTHISEELSDEALYELVQKFIRLLVNAVYKYEGMVDKLTGDGLMALFGAPIAHENNAERALRCALEMMQDVTRLSHELDLDGQELRIHVGLNAGSVIVGGLGSDGMMNYTAIGDSVNLSRRLEEAAEGGTILVSESVYRQTYRLFDFEALPPLQLKNVSHPVPAFRAIGPKDRPGSVRGLEGLHAPMIGREAEFQKVQRMVDRLVDDRQGGVVLLVGEGGMGKSRLTSEMKAHLDFTRLRILEGHSLTYRKSIAYWIFQDMLRGYLGVTVDSQEDEVRRRLAESVQALFKNDGREKQAYLEHMLSFEPSDAEIARRIRYLDPGQLRQQIFLAVRDLLLAEARQRPQLLILEDLHWADDASLDLVRFLLDSTRTAPILIYAISRPFESGAVQAIHERAGQRLADRYLSIRLQALQPDQSAQLLEALLSIPDLPAALREQIIQRSAGLPFYLEEILRMLIENNVIYRAVDDESGADTWKLTPGADVSAIGVPDTLQGLILTRFDRLAPVQRRVLQTASVVGYQFNGPVLQQVLGSLDDAPSQTASAEALDYLIEHEYVIPLASGPGGEETYQFKHVLVSDAVYSTLLQRDRRDLHTRTGQAIEQIYAGRLDSQIEVLASHFLRSPLLDRALHYLTLAGQKAARSYANEQARQLFSQALELLPKVDHTMEQAINVRMGLGDSLLIAGEYLDARDHLSDSLGLLGIRLGTGALGNQAAPGAKLPALDTLPRDERIRLISMLQRKIGQTHERQGDYEKALRCSQDALVMLPDSSSFDLERASILADTAWIHMRKGSLDQAESGLKQALSLAEPCGQLDLIATALNRLAGVYFQRNVVEQAEQYLTRSLALREQIGDVVAAARTYNNLGLLNWRQGNLGRALESFNRSLQLFGNLGDIEGLLDLHTNMGLVELERGNLDEAEDHFTTEMETAGEIGHFYHVCCARMHLSLLNVYAENWKKALEHGQHSLLGFQELGMPENQLDLYVLIGWAALGLNEKARLEDSFQHIQTLLSQDGGGSAGQKEGEGRALRLFARVASEQGDFQKARALLEKSAAIFETFGNPMDRSRAQVDLGVILSAAGDDLSAHQMFDEARQTFEHMGARLELERLERLSA